MKYPLWLPRPKAWGQAIVLSIQWIPVAIFARITIRPVLFVHSEPSKPILWFLGISFLVMIYILSLIHQYFWHKDEPSWLPHWQSWLEGIWGFAAYLFSVMMGLLIAFVVYSGFEVSDQETLELAFSISAIVVLAYCFHIRWSISQFFTKKSKAKINVPDQPNSNKVDPIESELNAIKAQMGLKQMNTVRDVNENR